MGVDKVRQVQRPLRPHQASLGERGTWKRALYTLGPELCLIPLHSSVQTEI